jgi:hypothetical protein
LNESGSRASVEQGLSSAKVTLPTFVGIGVPRAGTTWLHAMLSGHPDVFMPSVRKEIRFFDLHFDRGVDWYQAFFSSPEAAHSYAAIGEISPQYLYCEECPDRISQTLPGVKLILMLRHPVDRAYSHYGFVVQRRNYRGSFEEFLATRPRALEKGYYYRYVSRYLERFDRSDILPLVFEDAVRRRSDVRQQLASFLDVAVEGFPSSQDKINPSTAPRFGFLSNLAVQVGRRLRRRGLERIVDLGGRIGMRRLLTSGTPIPRPDPAVKRELGRLFDDDIAALESCLDIDLSSWRKHEGGLNA